MLALLLTGLIIAQTAPPPVVPSDPVSFLLGYGVLGLWVFLMMVGYLHTKGAMDYLKEQIKVKDALIAEQAATNQRLADAVEDLAGRRKVPR